MSKKFNRVAQGPFSLDIVPIVAPGVGLDFTHTLEEGYSYFINSIYFILDTSGVGGTRVVQLLIMLSDLVLFFASAAGTQVANETIVHNFSSGGPETDLTALTPLILSRLPTKIIVPGEARVTSNVIGIDAGDQFSDIHLYLQKWPTLED